MSSQKVLLTGATGFIGSALLPYLQGAGLRTYGRKPVEGIDWVEGNFSPEEIYSDALDGIDVVIHLAGISSAEGVEVSDLLSINVDATLNLAVAAKESGVKRFVFVSSAKVFGDVSGPNGFSELAPKAPSDAYGLSKCQAEDKLVSDTRLLGMDIIIIRPPIVYGPGVGGNFNTLLKLVGLRLPLPFGRANGHRSVVYLGNLVDFLRFVAEAENINSGIYHVSDKDSASLAELIDLCGRASNNRVVLLNFPPSIFSMFLRALGKRRLFSQLFEPFILNCDRTYSSTGWRPPFSLDEGLKETINAVTSRR